ncbi:MAG: malonate transporter [Rhodobacterales bacterium]|nr:MAG: malonate transporter [Rhodobacterales bacterium]
MEALLDVILPVFCVIGFGYVAVWRGVFSGDTVDALMKFTQNFAIPVLLFRAISNLDLSHSFDMALLISFYAGSTTCFLFGLFGGRFLFRRDWEESVVIGFCCLFANSLMLGLAVTEQAYGADALTANYAIVAVHSPFCYALGITVMEIVRARGQSVARLPFTVLKAMFRNALIVGISLGFLVNLTGLYLPAALTQGLDLIGRSALPVALFGMGGVLMQYRPEGDLKVIAYVCFAALILHPSITWTLGKTLGLGTAAFRSALITAAMAPGINTYVFASIYGKGRRVAASGVLIGTAISVFTIWLWLGALP